MKAVSSAAAVCGLLWAVPVAAQTCDPPLGGGIPVDYEVLLDDQAPFGSPAYGDSLIGGLPAMEERQGPIDYVHPRALKVTSVDFDNDGWNDILVSGNASEPDSAEIWFLAEFHEWTVSSVEHFPYDPPSGRGTSKAYNFSVGDVDGDGDLDIAFGRLLNPDDVGRGQRDTVFRNRLNDGGGQPGEPLFPLQKARIIPNPAANVDNSGAGNINTGSTFGIDLGDVDCDGDLDLISGGSNYSGRYYSNTGQGRFIFEHYYTEGFDGRFRDMIFEDVDNDGDLDLFVSRTNTMVLPGVTQVDTNRVWRNQLYTAGPNTAPPCGGVVNPSFDATNPFVNTMHEPMELEGLTPISWTSDEPDSGTCYTAPQTLESAFGDLDNDGYLDVVSANFAGLNCAYLNDGTGLFGCVSNDVRKANYVFPALTLDWTGQSDALTTVCDLMLPTSLAAMPSYVQFPTAFTYDFTVPGSLLNGCTGVAISDVDADGWADVGFSSRNDLEEVCGLLGLEYFNDDGNNPVPLTYDFLFFNRSRPGNLRFSDCVELIEGPNDGTGYGEFVDVDEDGTIDWLDANFSSDYQGALNRLYWTHKLWIPPCPDFRTVPDAFDDYAPGAPGSGNNGGKK